MSSYSVIRAITLLMHAVTLLYEEAVAFLNEQLLCCMSSYSVIWAVTFLNWQLFSLMGSNSVIWAVSYFPLWAFTLLYDQLLSSTTNPWETHSFHIDKIKKQILHIRIPIEKSTASTEHGSPHLQRCKKRRKKIKSSESLVKMSVSIFGFSSIMRSSLIFFYLSKPANL